MGGAQAQEGRHEGGVTAPRKALIITARAILCACIALDLLLAVTGYETSRLVGGAAAQGDLGLFMILLPVTPVVLIFTAAAWGLETFVSWRSDSVPRSLTGTWLAAASIVSLALPWFVLLVVMRR